MAKDAPLTALDKVTPVNAPESNHGAVTAAAEAYAPRTGDAKSTKPVTQSDAAMQKQLDTAFTNIFNDIKNGGPNFDAKLTQDVAALVKLFTPPSFAPPGGDGSSSAKPTTPVDGTPVKPSGDKPGTTTTGDKTPTTTTTTTGDKTPTTSTTTGDKTPTTSTTTGDKTPTTTTTTGDKTPTTTTTTGDKTPTTTTGDQTTATSPALPTDLKGNLPMITVRGNSDIQSALGGLGKLTETNGAYTLDAEGKQINPLYLSGVSNLTIKNAVFAADGMAGQANVGGVRMDQSDNVTVENSSFNGVSFGVLATDGDANVKVLNNTFEDMQGGQTFNNGAPDHQYFSSAVQIVNSAPLNKAEGNSDNVVSGNTVINQKETLNIDGKATTLYSWTNDNMNFGDDQFTYSKDGGPGLVISNNTIEGTGAGDLNANLQNSGSGMQFEFNTGVVPGDTPGNGKNAATTPVFVVEDNHVSGQITQGITDTLANHGSFVNNTVDLTNPSQIYERNQATGAVTDLTDRSQNTATENAALDKQLGNGVTLAPYTSWQAYGISNRSGDSTTNQFSGNEVIVPAKIPTFSGTKTQYNPLPDQPEINTTGDKPTGVTIVKEPVASPA